MFAGIVSHLGKLKKKETSHFIFEAEESFCKKLHESISVSVNGICLTIDQKPTKNTFAISVMPETLRKTMFGELKEGDEVNLELPITAETLISGHFIQGHVDGTGRLISIKEEGNSKILTIGIPEKLSNSIIEKGSIAVNGISLTVIKEATSFFTVGIVPYTWEHTMLHNAKYGDLINIELDMFVKYVEKILHTRGLDQKAK